MLVAAKTYALISEYALICDMRLITREYGIVFPCMVRLNSKAIITFFEGGEILMAASKPNCACTLVHDNVHQ